MKVELISHTPDALELLIFTKDTRLQGKQSLEDIKAWSYGKKAQHLDYMRKTIKSSWEFVDYTFKISGVTRAFTHQLVRTRTGAYAQESQRAVPPEGGYHIPEGLTTSEQRLYEQSTNSAFATYDTLIDCGVPAGDARGVLPTATHTSIIAKFSLRTLHEMGNLRLCTRTQGEYQDVFREMRELVYKTHPWAEGWIEVYCVNHLSCCFPNFKECPIKKAHPSLQDMATNQIKRNSVKLTWYDQRYAADPKVKGGMSHD